MTEALFEAEIDARVDYVRDLRRFVGMLSPRAKFLVWLLAGGRSQGEVARVMKSHRNLIQRWVAGPKSEIKAAAIEVWGEEAGKDRMGKHPKV